MRRFVRKHPVGLMLLAAVLPFLLNADPWVALGVMTGPLLAWIEA